MLLEYPGHDLDPLRRLRSAELRPPPIGSARPTADHPDAGVRLAVRRRGGPGARADGKFLDYARPVMERCRVEVCPVRPHERVDLWVYADLAEELRIL
jgi:hypothetical protein